MRRHPRGDPGRGPANNGPLAKSAPPPPPPKKLRVAQTALVLRFTGPWPPSHFWLHKRGPMGHCGDGGRGGVCIEWERNGREGNDECVHLWAGGDRGATDASQLSP